MMAICSAGKKSSIQPSVECIDIPSNAPNLSVAMSLSLFLGLCMYVSVCYVVGGEVRGFEPHTCSVEEKAFMFKFRTPCFIWATPTKFIH